MLHPLSLSGGCITVPFHAAPIVVYTVPRYYQSAVGSSLSALVYGKLFQNSMWRTDITCSIHTNVRGMVLSRVTISRKDMITLHFTSLYIRRS